MKLKRSKNKMIERFLQGFLIIILVILTIFMKESGGGTNVQFQNLSI